MTEPVLIDALGRTVPSNPPPRRILSLVPSVTECLFDLGAGGRTVGRTDYCISPPEARRLPSVGGPKSVAVELALDLRPDLVLANAEENDRGQVEELIAHGLRVHVAFPKTVAAAGVFLSDLSQLLGDTGGAEALIRDLRKACGEPPRPAVPCACLIWKNPYMTASADTLTSDLLRSAGAENVFAQRPERYPVITMDEIRRAGPRVILLPSEPYVFTEADGLELEREVPCTSTLDVPGEWVTWYGSRMTEALRGLRSALERFR